MVGTREPSAALLWAFLLLTSYAASERKGSFFSEDNEGTCSVSANPPVQVNTQRIHLDSSETDSIGSSFGEDRVHMNPDGTFLFECPHSVCGFDFFLGRDKEFVNTESSSSPLPVSENDIASSTSRASQQGAKAALNSSEFPVLNKDDEKETSKGGSPQIVKLKDIARTTDMTRFGVEKKAHYLAFLKNSICGGLYRTAAQLPCATADLACSISNLDENSIYLKRLESHRLPVGMVVMLAVNMSSAFARKANDRLWRRKLLHSPSLRLLVFLARAFGRLKPNIIRINPGTVINRILLQMKHLFYPLTELFLYIKACETAQSYPERLLQGFPNHVHPDHPSHLQLPIFSYLRKNGADVAFPKGAPLIFKPHVYDRNILVDRKRGGSKSPVFERMSFSDLIQKLEQKSFSFKESSSKASASVNTPQNAKPTKTKIPRSSPTHSPVREGVARPPMVAGEESSGKPEETNEFPPGEPPHPTKEKWKKQFYLAWHNLWMLNLVAYHAADLWSWLQYHKADTYFFPPWKVKRVGVLRTMEVAPLRWRNLSSRFQVDPIVASKSGKGEEQMGDSSQPKELPLTWETQFDTTPEHETTHADSSTSVGVSKAEATAWKESAGGSKDAHANSSRFLSSEKTDGIPQQTADPAAHHQAPAPLTVNVVGQTELTQVTGDAATVSTDVSVDKDEDVPPLPEGCPAHSTDMHFFKRLGLPYGRLTVHGPFSSSSSSMANEESGDSVGNDGSWTPNVVGAEVKCPPIVNPDTCGLTASFNRPYETPWMWLLERDENQTPKGNADNLQYADVVWIFRGTFTPKQWLLNSMGLGVQYKILSKRGKFHYGLTYLFDKAARPHLEEDLKRLKQRLANRTSPLVIVFTGHSLGAALAQLSAWYFAKRAKPLVEKGLIQIHSVVFGSPPWGDTNAYEDIVASGVKVQELNVNIDPVGVLFGEGALTNLSNKKPFLMKLRVEDMDKVEVASSVPGAPPFSGRVWTRPAYRPTPLLKRLAATVVDLEDVDMVLLDPLLAHFTAYTAFLTIMAGLLEPASYGSGVSAPFVYGVNFITGHTWNVALKAAHEALEPVLRRVEEDRAGN